MTRKAGRFATLPVHAPGQRVGLFGGSFDPPHAGHAQLVRTAMARLDLDAVWVLVTPGNPLKDASALSSFPSRAAALRKLLPEPRVIITDIEGRAGLRYTRDTIRYLIERAPGVRFVWLMGADNLASFHRWQDWERIAATIPIAVIDRPGASFASLSSVAALALADARQPETRATALAGMKPPAWVFLRGRRMPHSSTQLRQARVG
jgi:nicotinate-nucleotide adenylyltransferase